MVDMARLVARRNVKVTIVTTPLNAVRVGAHIGREIQSRSPIHIQLVQFPNAEAGIPEGCESIDTLPSMDLQVNILNAICLLQHPLEELFGKLDPTPTCIISDKYIPSVAGVAKKFKDPRIIFDGTNCFFLIVLRSLRMSRIQSHLSSPDCPIELNLKNISFPGRSTLMPHTKGLNVAREKVVNSFEELEVGYVKEYGKVTGNKVWCIGPVSLSNEDNLDKPQRAKRESNDEEGHHLKWMDSWPTRSVIYVCLGSLNQVTPEQLMEHGLGLEATKRPFTWVLRGAYKREEMEKLLLEDGLEDRVKGRGLFIRGWAPQVLILSHTAVGAFITHCGWNSTLEGICRGVPLITFPLFGDQFYNEKVAVQVVQTGVRVGAEHVVHFGEEERFGVQVKRENVKEAVERAMGEGEERERIRERARQYAEKAKKAVEKGGSSFLDMSQLIEDIAQHACQRVEVE